MFINLWRAPTAGLTPWSQAWPIFYYYKCLFFCFCYFRYLTFLSLKKKWRTLKTWIKMSASWKCSCEFWGIINQVLCSDVGLSSVNQQALMNRDHVHGRHKGKRQWAACSESGTSYKPAFLFKRIFLTFMTFPLVRLRHHRQKILRRIKSQFSLC